MKTSITRSNGKFKKAIRKGIVLAVWLGIWQLAYMLVKQDVMIASPSQVAMTLAGLVQTPEFWMSAGNSLLRVLAGFLLAVSIGTLLAVLTSYSRAALDFFTPAITLIKSTPVVSFIILALVWLKRDLVSVFISFLMVLPAVWTNISQGIARTDEQLLEMGSVFHFSKMKMLRSIYIPSVMPYFTAAFTTGLGLAWKAGIAAEVIGIPKHSIGQHLYDAKIYLETADLFAWTVVVILLSILVEHALVGLIRHLGKKYNVKGNEEHQT
ncbi:MAG TPA: nitrate ABC transporter permease [Ruminiclostridium sp.]|nr:nitrate ABC transporter permease [Ruminiclostridium sp.]